MKRSSQYPIAEFILNRWSPRAMSGEAISQIELMTLLEAAHWAPSSYNNQPWRFVYALKDTPIWIDFFNLLVEFNQSWCKSASALVIIVSKNNFDFNNNPSRTHSFDTGAACQNMALQGYLDNLVVHAMEGFDYQKAAQLINLPAEEYTVEAMVAIGKPGKITNLPPGLQEKEVPSLRKPLTDVVFAGEIK